MRGISRHGNREILGSPRGRDGPLGRDGKAECHEPEMNDLRKSDSSVVPGKASNKAGQAAAETLEGRGLAKGNAGEHGTLRTQSRDGVFGGLDRVREAARRDRKKRFTALLHYVTVDRLRGVFHGLHRKAAAGVDGVTWAQYAEDLEARLLDLHARLHRGAYRAKP